LEKSRLHASHSSVEVSSDGGESWSETQKSTDNNGNPPALAVHPHDSNIVLLGTWGNGILRTVDAGQTWSTANAGLTNLYVNVLTFDPRDPNIVYAGTDGGVFLSQDGGDSWTAVNDGLGRNLIVYSIAVDSNDSSRVFAITPDGMYQLLKLPSISAPSSLDSSAYSPTLSPNFSSRLVISSVFRVSLNRWSAP
jgi:photosystem II stability/assembly factor-like uncharacterized protein